MATDISNTIKYDQFTNEIHHQHHARVVCVSYLNIPSSSLPPGCIVIRNSDRCLSNCTCNIYVFGIVNFVFVILQETMVASELGSKNRAFVDMKSRQFDVQTKVNEMFGLLHVINISVASFLCSVSGCHLT